MKRNKLFGLAFLIAFVSTAVLCIVSGQPLIFFPVSYGLGSFLAFGILIGSLCFGLVFIALPFLRIIRSLIAINGSFQIYYISLTILILQILTMALGYIESYMTRGIEPTFFYYYKGIGNSLIYVVTGNVTAVIISNTYAFDQQKIEIDRQRRFDFEA